MQKNHDIQFNLKRTPKDKRDYSHHRTFGSSPVSDLPDEYIIKPLKIKNQLNSDMCSAFMATACAEDQSKVELSPEFQFKSEKAIEGDWKTWGANLRTACQVGVDVGFIPQANSPITLSTSNRDEVANPDGWDKTLNEIAIPYKRHSYFSADGFNDMFDNIRIAIWQNRDDNCSVMTGSLWYNEWTGSAIVPSTYSSVLGGHAFKIIGWKKIGTETYLIIQNSWGEGFGDGGLYYFPRSVVNKEFSFGGAFLFSSHEGTVKRMSLLITLMSKLVGLLNRLIAQTK